MKVHGQGMACEQVSAGRSMAGAGWPLARGGEAGGVCWCWLAGCNGSIVA